MSENIIIKTDCFFYEGSKPCAFHKKDGRLCNNCEDYKRIESRILIVKLDALGDVLRTTSILPALKKKYPNSHITWITKERALPILKSISLINRVFCVERNFIEYILNETFDVGICLDSDSYSSSILSIASCKNKYGFIADKSGNPVPVDENGRGWWLMGLNDKLKRDNRKTYQEIIHTICNLQYEKHHPLIGESIINENLIDKFINENGINRGEKIIGINTGGGNRWEWKKWILDYYCQFISLIKSKYPDFQIILFGGPEEIDFNKEIFAKVGNMVIDAGCHNTLEEFISKVKLSDIFLTSDSLGFHIASALKIKSLVLVGPTSPWELEVYDNGEIIYPDIECLSCYLNKCNKVPNCMQMITPTKVFAKFELWMNLK